MPPPGYPFEPSEAQSTSVPASVARKWWQFWTWNLTTGDGLALAGSVLAISAVLTQCLSSRSTAELQRKQEYVKIAVGILSAKATRTEDGKVHEFSEGEMALRRWAIQIINKSADARIDEKSSDALIRGISSLKHESRGNDGDIYLWKDGTPILWSDGENVRAYRRPGEESSGPSNQPAGNPDQQRK